MHWSGCTQNKHSDLQSVLHIACFISPGLNFLLCTLVQEWLGLTAWSFFPRQAGSLQYFKHLQCYTVEGTCQRPGWWAGSGCTIECYAIDLWEASVCMIKCGFLADECLQHSCSSTYVVNVSRNISRMQDPKLHLELWRSLCMLIWLPSEDCA